MEKVLIKSIIAAFVVEITGVAVNLFRILFMESFCSQNSCMAASGWGGQVLLYPLSFILYPFWIFAYGQEEGRRLNFAVFDKFKEYQEGGNE